ncbi:hypothetical protein [Rubritalea tangerina]
MRSHPLQLQETTQKIRAATGHLIKGVASPSWVVSSTAQVKWPMPTSAT